jgi:hypothetical protein
MSNWRGIATVLKVDGSGGSSEARLQPNTDADWKGARDAGERALADVEKLSASTKAQSGSLSGSVSCFVTVRGGL